MAQLAGLLTDSTDEDSDSTASESGSPKNDSDLDSPVARKKTHPLATTSKNPKGFPIAPPEASVANLSKAYHASKTTALPKPEINKEVPETKTPLELTQMKPHVRTKYFNGLSQDQLRKIDTDLFRASNYDPSRFPYSKTKPIRDEITPLLNKLLSTPQPAKRALPF